METITRFSDLDEETSGESIRPPAGVFIVRQRISLV